MEPGAPPALKVEGLRRRFGRRRVVEDVSLVVQSGVVGLLGPNGAGKTTLLRCVRTEIRPSSGVLEIVGFDACRPSNLRQVRSRIGSLPQDFGFLGAFTVEEFVGYIAWLKQVPAGQASTRVREAIGQVGLSRQAGTKMRNLSGGQRQRAGIAQAIVNRPQLLVLDEPTNGLDPEQRFTFRQLLRELGRDTAVLLATHLVEDVEQTCSRVLVLRAGTVVHDGTPSTLRDLGVGEDRMGDTPIERGYIMALQEAAVHDPGAPG